MLHAVNHSLAKAMLFLAAGNILAIYRTKSTTRVRGVLRTLPITGVLWLAGFLAIAGSPPFGPFLSELTILKGVLDAGHPIIAAAYLLAAGDCVCGHGDHRPADGLRPAARLDDNEKRTDSPGEHPRAVSRPVSFTPRAALVGCAGDGARAVRLGAGNLHPAATLGSLAPSGRRVGS